MDKQLAHFIGIIESGGLAAAADRLHVGQPALTASLKKLEERYGAQLVSRHNRGVRPTKSGELVYDHALLMQRLESGIGLVERLASAGIGLSVKVAVIGLIDALHLFPRLTNQRGEILPVR